MNFFKMNSDTKRAELRQSILKKGAEATQAGDPTEIAAAIDKATEEWFLETAEWIRGQKARTEKDFPRALEHFERALNLDPSFFPAHNSKVAALIDMGDFNEAIKSADYSIQHLMLFEFAPLYYNKGVALERLEQSQEALYCYFRALEDDQDYVLAYAAILNNLSNTNEWPKFLSTSAVFREKLKDKPHFLDSLGSLLLQLTEKAFKAEQRDLAKQLLEEAGNYLKIAVEKAPENPSIRYNLACFYSRSDNKNEALANLKKTFDLSDDQGKNRIRELSRNDVDFANIREDSTFKDLVSPP